MIVEFIQPLKFLSWSRNVEVALPEGVTLLLGDNGAGKSALALEAVAWALWKKTVRGTKPKGEVNVTAAAGGSRWRVERTDGAVAFLEDVPGAPAWKNHTGQTPTETQERIERVFGSWERFSSTRVFSRRLLNRFGAATDKDRKALLEEIMGHQRFERGYSWVREERGRRDADHRAAHSACMSAQAAADQARRALQSAVDRGGELPLDVQAQLVQKTGDRDELRGKLGALEKAHGNATRAAQAVREALAAARTEAGALARQIEALDRAVVPKVCPACKRPLEGANPADLEAHRAAERARLDAEITPYLRRAKLLEPQERTTREKVQAAASEYQVAHARVAALDREVSGLAERHRAALERDALLADLGEQVELAATDETVARAKLGAADRALAVADHACRVLGPKGARVRLMTASLALLEAGANAILPRLGGQVRSLKISGSRQKADGDEVAEVSIRVDGAGGGEYKGTSDGELGRVDAALLLALARLSGDRGYVCFDEPFDGLDREGLAGVCEVLAEMAEDRQVVVVTHSDELVGMFPAANKLRCRREGDGPSILEAA